MTFTVHLHIPTIFNWFTWTLHSTCILGDPLTGPQETYSKFQRDGQNGSGGGTPTSENHGILQDEDSVESHDDLDDESDEQIGDSGTLTMGSWHEGDPSVVSIPSNVLLRITREILAGRNEETPHTMDELFEHDEYRVPPHLSVLQFDDGESDMNATHGDDEEQEHE